MINANWCLVLNNYFVHMIYLSNNILFITMTFSRYYIYVQTFYTINNIFEIKTQNTSLKRNLILIASYTKRVLHKSHNHNQNNCLVQFREDLEFFRALPIKSIANQRF